MPSRPDPIVEVTGATVRYLSDAALDGVDFRMYPGEVHSLMGENGAGKSTLIKALTGAQRLDAGEIRVGGAPVRFSSPADAQRVGISAVYQEIDLLANLSVAENISLGREPRRWWGMDWAQMRRRADEVLSDLGVEVDPASRLGGHSLAVQQLVAIARAISADVDVLVLDEPTSSLNAVEVGELFRVIRTLKRRGIAILFVSHFLEQVYEICDRVTVLRDGKLVGEYSTRELLRIDLVEKMLGASAAGLEAVAERKTDAAAGPATLSGRGLRTARGLHDADLDLAEGEVLGIAGLLGSGRSELARAITGVDPLEGGRLTLDGDDVAARSPRQAMRKGIVYSSENRRVDGIIGDLSVLDNITLALQAQSGIFHRLPTRRRRELAASWVEALRIRPTDIDRPVRTLSGGNQQKVLLARLLALSPRIVVLDEPTRGIDVGAKAQIQRLVGELADNGLSIVYISAELDEVLRVAHLIAVMRQGELARIVPAAGLSSDALLALVAQAGPEDEVPRG